MLRHLEEERAASPRFSKPNTSTAGEGRDVSGDSDQEMKATLILVVQAAVF